MKVAIPTDPVELSFWVAMNLPIDDAQRLKVLQMDCAVPRLRMELSLLKKVNIKSTLKFIRLTRLISLINLQGYPYPGET